MKKISVKKALFILIILAVAGTVVILFLTKKDDVVVYETAKAQVGPIIQTVSETGTVKAVREINLSFLNAGKINKINVKIGDKVDQGAIIAELDYNSLIINQKEAKANIDVARGNLNKLLAGAGNEDIAVSKAAVRQAKTAYEAAQSELEKVKSSAEQSIIQAQKTLNDLLSQTDNDVTTYEQAIISAETALANAKQTYQQAIDNYKDTSLNTCEDKLAAGRSAIDAVNRVINDEDGKDFISVSNASYLIKTKENYTEARELLDGAEVDLSAAKTNGTNGAAVLLIESTVIALDKVFTSLKNCFSALENSITSASFSQAELDALKTTISTHKTAIGTAISAVEAVKQNLASAILAYDTNVSVAENSLESAQAAYDSAVISARNALDTSQVQGAQQITASESRVKSAQEALQVAQAQLNKILAPADKYDVTLAQARVRQAQAALDSINNQIENSLIKAPAKGTITKIGYEAGEQVSPTAPVISMQGDSFFEIEVLVSEADIAKVEKDDKAEITLDAFGDDLKFYGQVQFIEPAETIIQDVVYYKVKINFDPKDKDIKPGMTANIVITTESRDKALIVPTRAIIEKNGDGKYVRVLQGKEVLEKKVAVGLRGDSGMIEILSGIKEGEEVVTYVREEK